MKSSRIMAIALAGLFGLATSAAAQSYASDATPVEMDIVETAVAAGMFETLVAAVSAADLVAVLQSDGPFTVFAPTDEAFAALPDGTVETLLLPENKDKLVAILTYHVVPGKVMAADVVKLDSAKTVEGQSLRIKVKDGMVWVDDAMVVKADVETSNGVIHVVNKVLIPSDK